MADCRKKIVHLCLASFFIDNYSYQENILPRYHKIMGYDVTIIASLVSFDKNGRYILLPHEDQYCTIDGCKVLRVNYNSFFYKFNKLLRRYNSLYSLLMNERPDIIFIHGVQFLDITKVLRYKRHFPLVKLYCDNHADWINSATNFISKNILHKIVWKYCAKKLEPHVECFYGVTPLRCEFLSKMYKLPADRIRLLPMGVDDLAIPWGDRDEINLSIRSSLSISVDDFLIVTGGKIDEKKSIHMLIKAVKKLSYENIHLIIFGTIATSFKKDMEQLLHLPNVYFVGWKNSEQVMKYLLSADLAIFPGTHSVLWEQAVGLGLPSVFKYWNGMTHVDGGGNCSFLKSDNVDEIADVIEQIYLFPKAFQQMKNSALAFSANFHYSNIAKKSIENV